MKKNPATHAPRASRLHKPLQNGYLATRSIKKISLRSQDATFFTIYRTAIMNERITSGAERSEAPASYNIFENGQLSVVKY